jgi:hypothetical protein
MSLESLCVHPHLTDIVSRRLAFDLVKVNLKFGTLSLGAAVNNIDRR